MEKIKILLGMIYPFLISLFLMMYSYVTNKAEEFFLLLVILVVLFGVMFLVGLVLFVVQSVKDLRVKRKVVEEDHTPNLQ